MFTEDSSNSPGRSSNHLEDILYQHFQYWRNQENTEQLIERFRCLFLDPESFSDETVKKALLELSQLPSAERDFKYIINRCCYTLVNYWYTNPENHWAIPELNKTSPIQI